MLFLDELPEFDRQVEVAMMLHVTDTVCPAVGGYQFRNVTRLARDFEAGFFAPAVPLVSAPAPQGPRLL